MLVAKIECFEDSRWFHRSRINSRPTKGDPTADYWFCGDRQQPAAFNQLLRSMAPVIEGQTLVEACINRYLPGNYMPEHIDVGHYFTNMVVPITKTSDGGIEIEGQFYPDVLGEGVSFGIRSLPHAVRPVVELRYVIIYLYE